MYVCMCILHSVRRRRLKPPRSRRYAYSPRACPARRRRIFMTSYRSFWISWGPDASSSSPTYAPTPARSGTPVHYIPSARSSIPFLLFRRRSFSYKFPRRSHNFRKVPGLMESFCALEVFGFFDNPISDVRRTVRERKKRFRIVPHARRKTVESRCTCGKFEGAHNDILHRPQRRLNFSFPHSTPCAFIYSFVYLFFFCLSSTIFEKYRRINKSQAVKPSPGIGFTVCWEGREELW